MNACRIILTVALLLPRVALAAVVGTIDVDTGVDQNLATCTTGCSLRAAVQSFNSGALTCGCTVTGSGANAIVIDPTSVPTVTLSNAGALENNNATGDIDILPQVGDLTIQSATAAQITIDASAVADRVFDIHNQVGASAYTVIFRNLLMQGGAPVGADCGNATSDGGAVRVDFASFGALGACPPIAGSPNVDSTVFTGCSLINSLAANGGAIASKGARLTLNGTAVSGNTASAAGGGIYVTNGAAGSSVLAVQQSSFISNNTATGKGGGIDIDSASASVSGLDCTTASSASVTLALCVSASTISGNTSLDNGGGVAQANGDAIFDGTIVNGNNHASKSGGGIFTASGILAVQRSTAVVGNTADQSGGGIFAANTSVGATAQPVDCVGAGSGTQLSLCVNNANVSGNHANGGNGGGIALAAPSTQAVFVSNGSTIGASGSRNVASQSGGGIYASGTCSNNCGLAIANSSVSFNDASNGDGGGIDDLTFLISLSTSTIASNTAKGNGGGIADFASGASLATTGLVRIVSNTANALGGGLYTASTQSQNVTLGNVHLGEAAAGNTAAAGGGWYIDTTGPDSIADLKAKSSVVANMANSGPGGGIAIDHASSTGTQHPRVTLAADFINNTANTKGGAVYNSTIGTHTLVSGGTYTGNAAQDGGAIDNHQDGAAFTMPAGNPCLVPSLTSVMTVCNATIGAGGAGNSATVNNGGGIANESSLFVGDSTINQNTAAAGGGGVANANAGSLYILRSVLTNNHANGNDGGGVLSTGDLLLVADQISGNGATANGGGIANNAGGSKLAGVLYTSIGLNSAVAGGGIATKGGATRLNNVTIASNLITTTGNGAGLNSGGTNTQIANSIVDLNFDSTATPDCTGTLTSAGHNIYGKASTCINAGAGDSGQDNTTLLLITPLANFGGPTLIDALGFSSSAVNAGITSGADACGKLNVTGLATAPWLANVADNSDQRGVPVPQQPIGGACDIGAYEATPDLQINAKAAGSCLALIAGGSAGSFTTRVTNNTSSVPGGADVAHNIAVTFTLPAHVIFASVTPPSAFTSSGNCAAPAAGTVGPLSFACTTTTPFAAAAFPLDFGLSLALDSTTTPATAIIYTASVSDQTGDPVLANNSDSQTCTTTASVAVTLTKTDSAATISAGAAPAYIITLTNTGPSTASGVTVTDALPTTLPIAGGVLSAAWSCVASAGSSCAASGSGAINVPVTIAPGGTVTFTDITQTSFTLNNGSTITNQADVAIPGIYAGGCTSANLTACPGNTPSTCHACDKDNVTAAVSELGVSKTAPATIGQGATLTETTTLTVAGPSSSQNITLTDVGGSAATTFVAYTQDAAAAAAFTCSGVPAAGTTGAVTITCTSTGIVAVGTYVFTTTSTIIDDGSSPVPIPFSAALAHSGVPNELPAGDPQALPNAASGSVTIDIESDVAIALSASATINAGETLSYALIVTNLGPSTARGASFSMAIPNGTTFVAIDAPGIWSCVSPAADAGGTVTCTAGSLPRADGPQAFTIIVRVDQAAADGTTIQASASLAAPSTDSNPNNDGPVTATTIVGSASDLSLTLVASPSEVAPGSSIDYAIDVQNNGPSQALQLVLTLQLPKDVTEKSLTIAGFTCGAPSATGLITCTGASLIAGAADTGRLSVSVSAKAANGEVLVTSGTVSNGGNDTLLANNTASASVTVNATLSGNGPATFGGVTVNHGDVKERGGVFRCDSMRGNGATDLAALLGVTFMATRVRRRKKQS